jgi:pectate lyase
MIRYIFFLFLLASFQIQAQTVNLVESNGWLESAYVKWSPVNGADSYNVYLSGEGIVNRKLDNPLIRSYGTYFRADAVGLKAGKYILKVSAVVNGAEGAVSETAELTVKPHVRSGFAFVNGRVPGAYKADGTPKSGAVILYITENTKNTVSLDVTGASSNPCVGLQQILDGFKKGKDNRSLIIRMIGQITDLSYMLGGDIVFENRNNAANHITLEGIGDDAVADGWGIRLKNASNIEIRNLGIMNCDSKEGDNIGLQQNNDHIWVHHVDFFYGEAGGAADQDKGDGALDAKKSTNVTFSFNHFWDSGKSNLLGNGGEAVGNFTYHHNWYDHSDSRHPRVRQHTVHVYNNYFDGISKYGIGNTTAGSVFAEGNYFRNCKYPMLISNQGSDVFGSNTNTFSGDPGGMIKAYDNYIVGAARFVDQNDFATDFDAYVVANKSDKVPSSVKTVSGGHVYNNFDTDASMYAYTAQRPADAKNTVMQYAGRMFGGDFKWTFDNAVDDASSDVNAALKSALGNYKTKLVSVQSGDNNNVTDPDDGDDDTTPDVEITIQESQKGFCGVDGTIDSNHSGYTGSGFANTDNFTGKGVDYKIQVGTSGNYTITVRYANGATDRPADILYDGVKVGTIGLPGTGSWATWSSATQTVSLSSGTKSLRLQTTGSNGLPNIDYIKISGASVSAVDCDDTTTPPPPPPPSSENEVHNFTLSGKTSSFYNISGNLSDSKGTVTYNGLTLTQCLKIESSTSISFNAAQSGTLTLVFNSSFNGAMNVNGTSKNASSGILSVNLAAGNHTLTKADVANLFYISYGSELKSSTVSGLSEQPSELKLSLYPNPVQSVLSIEMDSELAEGALIEFFNISGNLIKNQKVTGQNQTMDVSDLKPGLYLVKVSSPYGSVISRLIKL